MRARTTRPPGRQNDPPVIVLVHGIGASHRYFRRMQRELALRAVVHAVDLPGFGGSPRPGTPRSIAQLAAALGRRLDELAVARAAVVGHSMGAQVALELALQRPGLVSHLALLGPVTDPDRATVTAQARDLLRDMIGEPVSANMLVLADYVRCGPRWYLAELGAMLRYPTASAVSRARCPVLVVRGTADPVARRPWAEQVAAAAVDGRIVEVHGRHLVQHSAAARTADEVAAFVSSQVQPHR